MDLAEIMFLMEKSVTLATERDVSPTQFAIKSIQSEVDSQLQSAEILIQIIANAFANKNIGCGKCPIKEWLNLHLEFKCYLLPQLKMYRRHDGYSYREAKRFIYHEMPLFYAEIYTKLKAVRPCKQCRVEFHQLGFKRAMTYLDK